MAATVHRPGFPVQFPLEPKRFSGKARARGSFDSSQRESPMSAAKSQKRVTRDKGQRRAAKPARKTAARATPRPATATPKSARAQFIAAPPTAPHEPRADLAELVRAVVTAELATRAAPATPPSAPAVSPSPFGHAGEKAVDQYTVRLTERERAVVELARTDRALWGSGADLPPTVALRRLAWEGARVLGILDRLTTPAQGPTAASAA